MFWFDRPRGNFGDDLNPWLWPKLLPGLIDADEREWLVGIGTLLNERLPGAGRLNVLGAGAGLGVRPRVDERWRVYGVRGPRTAAALGIDPALALGDPAILVADHVPSVPAVRRGIGLMPHYISVEHWDWRTTADELGMVFVDPEAPVQTTLAAIAGLECLVTEAMHGAIVADTLRVPWIGLQIADWFYDWKWHDWGEAIGITPVFHKVGALSAARARPLDGVKRRLIAAGLGARVTEPPPARSTRATVQATKRALTTIVNDAARQLSGEDAIQAAKVRLRAAVARLREDGVAAMSTR